MGASRSSLPSSTSRATPAAVRTFDTLPARNRVSGVTGTPDSTSARPNPSDQMTVPLRATATDRPGIPCFVTRSATISRALAIASASFGRGKGYRCRAARRGVLSGSRVKERVKFAIVPEMSDPFIRPVKRMGCPANAISNWTTSGSVFGDRVMGIGGPALIDASPLSKSIRRLGCGLRPSTLPSQIPPTVCACTVRAATLPTSSSTKTNQSHESPPGDLTA